MQFVCKAGRHAGTSMGMTKPTSCKVLALLLAAAAFGACGTDPYTGTSGSTGTKTVTVTDTVTITDTNGDTATATGIHTKTEVATQTSPVTSTDTQTATSTGPTTMTVTSVVTVTVTNTDTGGPDAGIADAAPPDPSYPDIYISVAPNRQLDLLFTIDNSPSMAPKVAKLNAQFPKLINALKDPNDGTLPDLRVAIIDSDLGTGGAYQAGSCGPKTLPDGTDSTFGDVGRFQMLKTPQACTFDNGALFLEYKGGMPVNYPANADISSVFACLASNLGTLGCGMEHQLQAFEFALVARGINNEEQQTRFLRANAQLGLVFLTDEDDCSAATNDGLFGDKPDLRGESASLRCATRGHMCGGQKLSESGPGYPTTASYTHAFADCQARTDPCPNPTDGDGGETDTSNPTSCAPLKNLKRLANEIKGLRSDPSQVFVAGIFGWPTSDADMATAQYKIAPVPNPNTADTMHPTVYDYWPVCYDPDHMPSANADKATGFDATAAGWGATGGLRESAFIDEFGSNGMKWSICERDFSASMKGIGDALSRKMQDLCFDYKLVDSDLTTAGVQGDCEVRWETPREDPQDPTKVIYIYDPQLMPQCPAGAINGNVAEDCWQLTMDIAKCPANGQLVNVLRTAEQISNARQIMPGTRVHMKCHVCLAGSTDPGCNYSL
jgi:hypothetical protein